MKEHKHTRAHAYGCMKSETQLQNVVGFLLLKCDMKWNASNSQNDVSGKTNGWRC